LADLFASLLQLSKGNQDKDTTDLPVLFSRYATPASVAATDLRAQFGADYLIHLVNR